MPRETPSRSGSHRSWRKAGETRGHTSSRAAARWATTFLVLLLVGLFAWVLWVFIPSRVFHMHFVAITTGEAHIGVPVLPFRQEDLISLREANLTTASFHDFSVLLEADKLQGLGQRLRNLDIEPKDAVILHVSAHGVSDQGSAYLLGRDFDGLDPNRARYQIGELLRPLEEISARVKFLSLDVGSMPWDPLLGLAANELPRLLAEEVASHDDPELWVMVSHGLLENNCVDYQAERTTFGHGVVRGLRGAADDPLRGGNGDGQVAVDELYRFVAEDCHHQSGGRQMPLLLHGGEGLVPLSKVSSEIFLSWAEAVSPEDDSEDADSDENTEVDKTDKDSTPEANTQVAGAEGQEPSTQADSAAMPAEEAGESPPDTTTARTAPRSQDALEFALEEAWRVRDRFDRLAVTEDRWVPAEYAPQLWQAWNTWLTHVDQASRAGMAFDRAGLVRQVEAQTAVLRTLLEDPRSWNHPASGQRIAQRLAVAAYDFEHSTKKASFDDPSPEFQTVTRAIRAYYRAAGQIPGLIDWHATVSWTWPNRRDVDALHARLQELMSHVADFATTLRSRKDQRVASDVGSDSLVARARLIEESLAELDALREQQVVSLERQAADPSYRSGLARLLELPLWTTEERKRLIASLRLANRSSESDKPPAALADIDMPTLSVDPAVMRRIAQTLELWQRWTTSVDTPFGNSQTNSEAGWRELSQVTAGTDRAWEVLRDIGASLRGQLLDLRQLPRDGGQNATADGLWRVNGDGRQFLEDGHEIAANLFFPECHLLPPKPEETVEIVQSPGGDIRLSPEAETLALTILPSRQDLRSVNVTLRFDESLLRLRDGQGNLVASGRRMTIPLAGNQRATADWKVSLARSYAEAAGQEFSVVAEIEAGEMRRTWPMRLLVPRPNEVELVVERIVPVERARQYGRHGTELHAFPNRTTHFRLLLSNLSDIPKEVQVGLYAVPPTTWAPGRLVDERGHVFEDVEYSMFQAGTDRLLPGLRPLLETAGTVSLPVGGDPRAVSWSLPASGNESGTEPVAASSGQDEFKPLDITHGLMCRITSAGNSTEAWTKWIEIHPVHPHEFLDVNVRYDLRQAVVEARPIPDKTPQLSREPLEIVWDTRQEIPPESQRSDQGTLRVPSGDVRLFAELPPHRTRSALIPLDVDGYPHAFLFRVGRDVAQEGRDIRRDARRIRIDSLTLGNREYRAMPTGGTSPPAAGGGEQEVFDLRQSQAAAFSAAEAAKSPLQIKFHADLPINTFTLRGREEYVELALEGTSAARQRFHADREMQASITGIDGESLSVETRISNFTVPFDLRGLQGKARLVARAQIAGGTPPDDAVDIIVDGQPPRFLRPQIPSRVRVGEAVLAYLEIADLSGPARVEAGLVARRDEELPADKALVKTDFPPNNTGNWPVSFSIPSSDLKPGTYYLKIRATDRVGLRTTETLRSPVEVLAAPTTTPKDRDTPQAPARGTLRGIVRFGSSAAFGIRVTIKELSKSTESNSRGIFQFEDIPAGTYTLEAEGPAKGRNRSGEARVQLQTRQDFAKTWPIALQ